jgi:asparagine synthase (glutamine-hydrolysing)
MCGIFGQLNLSYQKCEQLQSNLDSAITTLGHRGPDQAGTWAHEKTFVGFAHTRLSIIDLQGGKQPMGDTGYHIVFNGEIYNYKELASSHMLGPLTSDTEVLLEMYKKYGARCLDYIDGMFSFAIWDNVKHELFCARDHTGIKPLYYTVHGNNMYFSSEIKALLRHVDEIKMDRSSFCEYITFQFTLGANTMFSNIKQLMPGHSLTVDRRGEICVEEYWKLCFSTDFDHTEEYFTNKLDSLLTDSITSHLISDVPIGGYVSGGIDSSLVAAICTSQYSNFTGYTGRFTGTTGYDESQYARKVAKKNKFDLHVIDIDHNDFENNINQIMYFLDQPIAGPGAFSQYMVAKEASKHHKVLLSGHGGDEMFGGYARYLIAYFEQCIKSAITGSSGGRYILSYDTILDSLSCLSTYIPTIKRQWADGLFGEMDERYFNLIDKSYSIKSYIPEGFIDDNAVMDNFKTIFNTSNVPSKSYFDLMTHFDLKTLLPALLHVEDRISMAHGIETRVPLLDKNILEFCSTIPSSLKFKNGKLKYLLRQCSKKYLPKKVYNRKDKMGFPTPFMEWARGPLKELICDTLTSTKAINRDYIDNGKIVSDLHNGNNMYDRSLWGAFSLELWHKIYIDKMNNTNINIEPNTGIDINILAGIY